MAQLVKQTKHKYLKNTKKLKATNSPNIFWNVI